MTSISPVFTKAFPFFFLRVDQPHLQSKLQAPVCAIEFTHTKWFQSKAFTGPLLGVSMLAPCFLQEKTSKQGLARVCPQLPSSFLQTHSHQAT